MPGILDYPKSHYNSLSIKDEDKKYFSRDYLPIVLEAIDNLVASEKGPEKHRLK